MPSEAEFAASRARLGRPAGPPGLALLGCALARVAAALAFGVGVVTIWRWAWR
jgi:hypothetical protein